jgi:hypothetical protein
MIGDETTQTVPGLYIPPTSTGEEVARPSPSSSFSQPARFTSNLLLSDEEIRALGVPEHDVELFRRQRYQAAFGIESWYDQLKEYTFYTRPLPISFDEAKALVDYHNLKYLRKVGELAPNQQLLLIEFEKKIDQILEEDKEHFADGAFIKLNTRSPKDVPVYDFYNPRISSLVQQELDNLYRDYLLPQEHDYSEKEKDLDNLIVDQSSSLLSSSSLGQIKLKPGINLNAIRDGNAETHSFVVATNKALRIRSGQDALYLLTRSDRICQDLSKLMPYGPGLFSATLMIRQWLSEVAVRPQYEFRAFVHQNKLNAMSQFFCFCK